MSMSYEETNTNIPNIVINGKARNSSLFHLLSRMGIGLLSFFAQFTGERPEESSAEQEGDYVVETGEEVRVDPRLDDKCCTLASSTECSYTGSKSNYRCPPGYSKTIWFCCEGTRRVGCGECSSGPTCWDGPWACSIWWWTSDTICRPRG